MGRATARTSTRRSSKGGGLAAVRKTLEKAAKVRAEVKIGLPKGGAPYPDGTPVLLVGATHEFGSADGRIPERSFLRSSYRSNLGEYRKMAHGLALKIRRNEIDVETALELLGTQAASDVTKRIVDLRTPPNSPRTVELKGSSNPLVDDGHLKRSVTHQVVKKGR